MRWDELEGVGRRDGTIRLNLWADLLAKIYNIFFYNKIVSAGLSVGFNIHGTWSVNSSSRGSEGVGPTDYLVELMWACPSHAIGGAFMWVRQVMSPKMPVVAFLQISSMLFIGISGIVILLYTICIYSLSWHGYLKCIYHFDWHLNLLVFILFLYK